LSTEQTKTRHNNAPFDAHEKSVGQRTGFYIHSPLALAPGAGRRGLPPPPAGLRGGERGLLEDPEADPVEPPLFDLDAVGLVNPTPRGLGSLVRSGLCGL
jgi:hypothetical protein